MSEDKVIVKIEKSLQAMESTGNFKVAELNRLLKLVKKLLAKKPKVSGKRKVTFKGQPQREEKPVRQKAEVTLKKPDETKRPIGRPPNEIRGMSVKEAENWLTEQMKPLKSQTQKYKDMSDRLKVKPNDPELVQTTGQYRGMRLAELQQMGLNAGLPGQVDQLAQQKEAEEKRKADYKNELQFLKDRLIKQFEYYDQVKNDIVDFVSGSRKVSDYKERLKKKVDTPFNQTLKEINKLLASDTTSEVLSKIVSRYSTEIPNLISEYNNIQDDAIAEFRKSEAKKKAPTRRYLGRESTQDDIIIEMPEEQQRAENVLIEMPEEEQQRPEDIVIDVSRPAPKPASKPAPKPASKPAPKPAPKPTPKPAPKPAPKQESIDASVVRELFDIIQNKNGRGLAPFLVKNYKLANYINDIADKKIPGYSRTNKDHPLFLLRLMVDPSRANLPTYQKQEFVPSIARDPALLDQFKQKLDDLLVAEQPAGQPTGQPEDIIIDIPPQEDKPEDIIIEGNPGDYVGFGYTGAGLSDVDMKIINYLLDDIEKSL